MEMALMRREQIIDEDIEDLLARVDPRFVGTIQMDIMCFLRRSIGEQVGQPGRWIAEEFLQFGDTGVTVTIEDGIPSLIIDHDQVIDLTRPVRITIANHAVFIDLMHELRKSWHWLHWSKYERVPWKRHWVR